MKHDTLNREKSLHDTERDRIASCWTQLSPFECASCKEQKSFPPAARVTTEVPFDGRLRADVAATGSDGQVVGVVEVVYSHPPTERVLAAQENLGFAYYRLLPLSWRSEPDAWLCSPECWVWYRALNNRETVALWEPRKCDECEGYFHQNSLSWFEFHDWADDPNWAYCIHCAAACGNGQWRTPGELAGGDPREWTPDDDADPVALFLAYSESAFWSMVWNEREAKLGTSKTYNGSRNEAAEEATARRLPVVNASFDTGDWERGANLLLPVGAPGWLDYSDEPERMLAFRPENCRGTAAAWKRLLSYRLGQLPEELSEIVLRHNE